MNQKLRVLLFGTLLLGAFLFAGSLSSQVFAATAVNHASGSTPSFTRPYPDVQNYNRGYRVGFSEGYRYGLKACAEHHYASHAPYSPFHLTAYTRGFADGYVAGYNRGLHTCSGYNYGHHDYSNHNDNHQDYNNHNDNHQDYNNHDSQVPVIPHTVKHL